MQYRVAICDDMVFFVDEIKERIEKFAKEQEKQIEMTAYLDGADFIPDAKKKKFDIVFLDVDMPVLDGIETARKLREFDEDIVIIFVTSHDEFCLEASQVEAMGYLLKPVEYDKLYRIMKKAFVLIQGIQEERQQEKRYIQLSIDYDKMIFDVTKIVYMEKCRNQMIIHMYNGKEYTCYETLKNMMTRLPRTLFFQVSNSLIVNMSFVKDVRAYVISLVVNQEIKEFSIARNGYINIRSDFYNFLKKKGKK